VSPLSPLKIFWENTKGVILFVCCRWPIVKPPLRLLAEKNSWMMTESRARAEENPYTHVYIYIYKQNTPLGSKHFIKKALPSHLRYHFSMTTGVSQQQKCDKLQKNPLYCGFYLCTAFFLISDFKNALYFIRLPRLGVGPLKLHTKLRISGFGRII
jgi:hypothetical protein